MSSIVSMQKKPLKRRGKSLWMKNVLTRTIILPFKSVGGNIIQIIKALSENPGTCVTIVKERLNDEVELVPVFPNIVSGVGSLLSKTDDGWKDTLKRIKSGSGKGNTIKT